MSAPEVNIRALDAAYVPFPSFKEWVLRTAVETARWDRYTASLKKLTESSSGAVLERARNIAKRAAAIDTGAIEGLYEVDRGFTFTVALETAAWETALAQKGENVRSLFEAQLHAYDYVLDLATKAEPISEAAIRVLHEVVTRAQETYRVITAVGPQEQKLPKGQYKALPNHVRTRKGNDHSYAPVDVTPAEMARLVAELRSEAFLGAHPVLQAAYGHYGLVVIHPFADGNGRVARALASAFTYRAVSMPIVILSEHKNDYLDALEAADSGAYQSFVDFMLARSLDTITLVEESVRSAFAPAGEDSVAAITKLYITRGGYTQEQVDEAGMRLVQTVVNSVIQTSSKFSGPRIGFAAQIVRAAYPVPAGYRLPLQAGTLLHVALSAAAPAQAQAMRRYELWLPRDAAGDDDVQLVNTEGTVVNKDRFLVRTDDLIPATSSILQIRINMFAERLVNEMLAELRHKAEAASGKR
jgi:Fic family protein